MNISTQLIACSCIWAGISVAAYLAGSSSAPGNDGESTGESGAVVYRQRMTRSADDGSRSDARRSASERVAREYAEKGPGSTLERIFTITDPLRRGDEFRNLIDRLAPEDFEEFISAFRESGLARENGDAYRMALYVWAKKDPLNALAYAEENTRGNWTKNQLLASWAQYDLAASEAWATSKHDGEGANPYLVGIIEGIAATDLSNATRLLQDLPYSEERGDALREVINQVGKLDMDEAVRWLAGLGDERLQNGATERLADRLGETHGAEAARWAETFSDETRVRALSEVAEGWVRRDIDETMSWVQSLSPTDQIAMAADFANDLGRRDFGRAQDWLASLGNDPAIDEARMRLAWTGLRGGNRDQAVAMIETIANSDSPQADRAKRTLKRINQR